MPEILTLTAPLVQTRTTYEVKALIFDWDASIISVRLFGSDGASAKFNYTGSQAIALMTTLNTANLSTKSLQKRILEKLVADGFIAGTITGTPI